MNKNLRVPVSSSLRLITIALLPLIFCFTPSPSHAQTTISIDIQANTTWTLSGSPYIITSNIFVRNNAKLTIQPGVVVKFNPQTSIYIGAGPTSKGALDSRGTSTQPIVFTSAATVPANGDWEQITFNSYTDAAQTFVDNVIVEYAGYNLNNAVDLNAPIQITNAIIRNNKGNGVKINSVSATLTNNRFENNGGAGVEVSYINPSLPVLRNNTYVNNGINGIKLGSVYSSTTWTKDNAPYIATDNIFISGSTTTAVLKIEPGVTVKFNPGTSLRMGNFSYKGALDARGTALQPIVFTSAVTTPVPGSWSGILFTNDTDIAQTFINNVIIEYAGSDTNDAVELQVPLTITNAIIRNNKRNGIYVRDVSATLTNNRFESNEGAGIEVSYGASSPVFRNNTYVNNGVNAIKVITGVYSSTLWTKDNVPYLAVNDLSVAGNPTTAVLKIEPGVTVKFNPGTSLRIGGFAYIGALDARGTTSQPIIFTSAATTPSPGNWRGILFDSYTDSSQTYLDNAIVEYAGSGTSDAIQIYAPVKITNSIIRNNQNSGISIINTARPVIVKNQVTNNSGYGIAGYNGAYFAITQNSFTNNTLGGVNSGSGGISAIANWWGSSSGPSGIGPGTGQSAMGNVTYEPWMGEAFNPNLFFDNVAVSPRTFNQNQGGSATFYAIPNKSINWTITIKNSSNVVVKTFTGTGNTINQQWTGNNASNQVLPNGLYNYVVSISDPAAPTVTASLLGRINLDSTLPVAKILTPQPYATLANQVQITGTAAGTGFSSYILEYGLGENPSQWTQIATSSTPVTNGVLGTWTTPIFTNPNARIRLTVRNAQNVTAEDSVPVLIYSVYNLNDDTDPFSPDGDTIKDTTLITANFTLLSNYTLTIKDSLQNVIKIFTGSGTSMQVSWNGRNQSNVIVPDGVYNYQVAITNVASGASTVSLIGTVTVDRTVPTASFASPAANAVISGSVTVTGTATDTNFLSYELEYGAGDVPTVWTSVILATTPVSNGTLGIWDTKYLANGIYNLRLTVKDSVGHTKSVLRKVSLDNISITNVSVTSKFINPAQNEISTLSFTLDRAANVTIEVYRIGVNIGLYGDGTFFREYQFNLINNVAKTAGVQTVTWNGKNTLNQFLSPSAYSYLIKAVSGTKSGVYDPIYVPGSVSLSNLSLSPTNFNPYANESVQLNYTLSAPAWVTIGGEFPANFPAFLLTGKPRPAGANTEIWDGRDGLGNIYNDNFNLTLSMKTEILPSVFTVITDGSLQITDLKTNPFLIFPTYDELTTISYSINRTADIILRIIDPNGNSWVITQATAQAAGNYTYQWKGRASNGSYVKANGNYRIELLATDPTTSATVKRSANVSIYK